MRRETILWTALPNGVTTSGRLRLSVIASPRLWSDVGTNPTLSQFPDFLDWPGTLARAGSAVQFAVQFGAAEPVPADIVGEQARSDLWTALFNANTPIQPYTFDNFTATIIRSYPIRNVMAFLSGEYGKLAANSGDEFPAAATLQASLLPIVSEETLPGSPPGGLNDPQLAALLESILSTQKAVPPDPPIAANLRVPLAFLQLKLFHQPRNPEIQPLEPPDIDFHKVLSILGSYPRLLRLLGLVYDLELDLSAPRSSPPPNQVQVIANWTPSEGPTVVNVPSNNPTGPQQRLMTRCLITTGRGRVRSFTAVPRRDTPDIVDGMLAFDDAKKYEVVEVDPDGSAIKVMDFADNLVHAAVHQTDDTPTTDAMPSLRSAGLSVARIGQALAMHGDFSQADHLNAALQNGDDIALSAEDLTKGYRIDVWDDDAQRWYSLHRRRGTYTFSNGSLVVTDDPNMLDPGLLEGYAAPGMSSAVNNASTEMFLHESLFRWAGWSLSARRLGKILTDRGGAQDFDNQPLGAFDLGVSFKAEPGTLPRLRFGKRYRLRARAVDLAGNSRRLDDPALTKFLHATAPFVFGRFDPVVAPALVMRRPRTAGESLERLVIRSNFNVAAMETNERHIAPPKTSETMAEELGQFDDPRTGMIVRGPAWTLIADKDPGSFDDVKTGDDPNNYGQPYIDQDSFTLPYLPDPLAKGTTFHFAGLPPVKQPFAFAPGRSWPDAQPYRLVVEEGPEFSAKAVPDGVRVTLAKADVIKVRLSSYLDTQDVTRMGLLKWVQQAGPLPPGLLTKIADGLHWMFTPYRELTLVHAVRQPLAPPRFDKLHAEKQLGQTYATLVDVVSVDGKSSVKVDVFALWKEPIDALNQPEWQTIDGGATAFEVHVPDTSPPTNKLQIIGRHAFGDTKYRLVSYIAVATTRFSEYFAQETTVAFSFAGESVVVDVGGIADGSEHVSLNGHSFAPGVDYSLDGVFGTMTNLPGGAIPLNTPISVRYVVRLITRASAEEENPVRVTILNSARPAAPKVLYVVPTFGWDEPTPTATTVKRTRLGRGLRVYLDRPWWSSGDGELLGVVLWAPRNGAAALPPDALKPYVTQWGMDPVFQSGATSTRVPTLAAFPRSKPEQQRSGLTLDELPGVQVSVAGHTAYFDRTVARTQEQRAQARGLWFCDIEVTAGASYAPFIRLALARFQPNSVPDAHLSRVVLADFVQLAPDRTLSITRVSAQASTAHVTLSGLSYRKVAGVAGPSRVEVTVERQNASVTDPDLGWEAQGGPTLLQPGKGPAGTTIWQGDVELVGGQNRLVIREFERFYDIDTNTFQGRLVYTDVVIISGGT